MKRYLAILGLLGLLIAPLAAQEDGDEGVTRVEAEPPRLEAPTDNVPDSPFFPQLSQQTLDPSGILRSDTNLFDAPAHASIIDRQQLTERAPTDIAGALEREVGVLIQRTGAGQVSPFVRGLTGPQTLLLVDGIRLNNSTFRFGPNQYFGLIDPGMIERIEIVRGPQSVLYGSDAIGGVINVVTRSADGLGIYDHRSGAITQRVTTATSSSYTRADMNVTVGRTGVFGGSSYLNVRNVDRGGGLGRQPFTNYSQYAGDVKLDYLLDYNQRLTVSLQHVEQTDVPRSDKFPGEARLFSPQQRDLGYIRWRGSELNGWIDNATITGSFGRQKEGQLRRRPPNSTTQDVKEFDVETTGISMLFSKQVGWVGEFSWGVDWYHDDLDSTAMRIDLTGMMAPTALTPQFPDDSFYERIGTFLQWETQVTDRLAAVSGVRYTNIDLAGTVALFDINDPNFPNVMPIDTPLATSFQDWTYSVGLVYELGDGVHLVGSIAEGFRAPGLDELMSFSDNVNEGVDVPTVGLSPESSINYEVGFKLDREYLRGQAYVFWTDLDGLIDRVLVGTDDGGTPGDPSDDVDFFQRRNVGRATVQGVELAGEYLLGDGWALHGNFWYTFGRNETADEPLSRIPPAQGVIGLRWRDECGWFDVYGWIVDNQDRLSPRDARDSRIPAGGTPGYGTLNIRAGRYLAAHHRVSVNLENIFDQGYRVHGSGVDGPGISATFGYEFLR